MVIYELLFQKAQTVDHPHPRINDHIVTPGGIPACMIDTSTKVKDHHGGLNYWSSMRGVAAVFIPVDRQTGWVTQPTILSEFRTQVGCAAKSTYPR